MQQPETTHLQTKAASRPSLPSGLLRRLLLIAAPLFAVVLTAAILGALLLVANSARQGASAAMLPESVLLFNRQVIPLALIAAGASLPIVLLVLAGALQRILLTPLARVQAYLEQISRGEPTELLPPSGPLELYTLGETCNQLAIRRQQQEQEATRQTQALEANAARYQAIIEEQSFLFCRTLADGSITFVNQAFCRYFGKPREELIGSDFSQLLSADNLRIKAALLQGLSREHPEASHEFRIDRAGQKTAWLEWTDRALFDGYGQLTEYAGTGRDTTRRKQAEDALRLAREEAEAATSDRCRFMANMSHEIRTPMNAILGMSQLAMETRDQDKLTHCLTTVKHSAEDLLGLLSDILDLAQLEAGQMEVFPVPLDLRHLIDTVHVSTATAAREKGLHLEICIDPGLPQLVMADGRRLRQILSHLLDNAIKFTAAGSVTLTIARQPASEPGGQDQLSLKVSDTGIGVAAEKQATIFNAFEQGGASYTRQHEGAGLGLAISSRLAALMGGTLSMASVDQQGSCFHCLLPLQPCLDEEQTKGTARPIDGSSLRSGLRILLVDDNEVSRELAGMMLEPSHLVTIAANGIEALVKLAFDRFDLVLMDVQMPVLDGLGATALIRTLEADRPMDIRLPQHVEQLLRQKLAGGHLPIVAMTAHALGGDEEICLSSGMDDYLAKPFDATQLVQVLERVIRTRPLKQPAPQPKPL